MLADPSTFVMAGRDPAIHEALRCRSMDDRDKPGHDDQES